MNRDYENKYLIPTDQMELNSNQQMHTSPYMPFTHGGYIYEIRGNDDFITPSEYTDWRDESLSWHYTASIHEGLNPMSAIRIKGPEAVKFLKENFVNNFDKFPLNSSKHGVICTPEGYIAIHGVLQRHAEDEFLALGFAPYIDYLWQKGNYDANYEDLTGKVIFFQLQGPRSLELLEEVTNDDLHDIKFIRFKDSSVDEKPVKVLRFGMSNGLGYELYCNVEDSQEIYLKIMEIGRKYGLRRLGRKSYFLNHTPGGSQQLMLHFMPGTMTDTDFAQFAQTQSQVDGSLAKNVMSFRINGSLGEENIGETLVSPFEIGLGKVVDFNKGNFHGRDALLAKKEENNRDICTLKWNADDVVDIFASQFREGEEMYDRIDNPQILSYANGGSELEFLRVLDLDGNEIGYCGGRTQSPYHRAMLSAGVIKKDFIKEENEVIIVWGEVGSKQKKVRATIAPFPYNKHLENRTFDIESIPRRSN
ncbi:hypothetical protein [Fundicoccus culcitae]|uniref:GCVT N-terminal domain-containing protein n=1 Tax=Fundicoccus culcitae TaxID=2969821 RepID=A0ABY5P4P0_9LACT|nr:hypothetical protein [Fundicoccus culcitae]UUX33373.1 hypothetical protein NRE15_10735 [Fundicoccus culcitae]